MKILNILASRRGWDLLEVKFFDFLKNKPSGHKDSESERESMQWDSEISIFVM